MEGPPKSQGTTSLSVSRLVALTQLVTSLRLTDIHYVAFFVVSDRSLFFIMEKDGDCPFWFEGRGLKAKHLDASYTLSESLQNFKYHTASIFVIKIICRRISCSHSRGGSLDEHGPPLEKL